MRGWTDADDAKLREMVAAGKSYGMAAEALGRTRNSCIGRGHRLGLETAAKPKRLERKEKAVEAPAQTAVVIPFPSVAEPKGSGVAEKRPFIIGNRPLARPRYEQPEAARTPFGIPRPLERLDARHCRFPVAQTASGEHLFCCAERSGSSSYCAEHHAVAWKPTKRQLTKKAYR